MTGDADGTSEVMSDGSDDATADDGGLFIIAYPLAVLPGFLIGRIGDAVTYWQGRHASIGDVPHIILSGSFSLRALNFSVNYVISLVVMVIPALVGTLLAQRLGIRTVASYVAGGVLVFVADPVLMLSVAHGLVGRRELEMVLTCDVFGGAGSGFLFWSILRGGWAGVVE